MPRDPEKVRAYNAAYRAAHREELLAYDAAYRAAHAAQRKAQQAVYRAANSEKMNAKDATRRLANIERIHVREAAYRLANVEKIKVRQAADYVAHQAYRLEAVRAYQSTHPPVYTEKIKVRTSAYRAAHPEQFRAYAKTRRARKANAAINDFTAVQWRDMQEHYQHRCVYCGKRCKGHLTQDHITPLSKSGNHTMSNIVPACRSCNSKKRTDEAPHAVQPLLL